MPTLTWTEVDAIATIGDPISIAALDEIQTNVNALNNAIGVGAASSTGKFGGPTGTTITFANQGGTSYLVLVTPSEDPEGNLGEVWVVNNSATQATVYNSGTATTGFRFKVVP